MFCDLVDLVDIHRWGELQTCACAHGRAAAHRANTRTPCMYFDQIDQIE